MSMAYVGSLQVDGRVRVGVRVGVRVRVRVRAYALCTQCVYGVRAVVYLP